MTYAATARNLLQQSFPDGDPVRSGTDQRRLSTIIVAYEHEYSPL